MKGYYCVNPRGRHYFLVPFDILAVRYREGFKIKNNRLDRICDYIKKEEITKSYIESEKGWDVCEVEVSGKKIRKLKSLLNIGMDNEAEFLAVEIIKKASKDIVFSTGGRVLKRDFTEDLEDDEFLGKKKLDDEDYWWLRGEEPPKFS